MQHSVQMWQEQHQESVQMLKMQQQHQKQKNQQNFLKLMQKNQLNKLTGQILEIQVLGLILQKLKMVEQLFKQDQLILKKLCLDIQLILRLRVLNHSKQLKSIKTVWKQKVLQKLKKLHMIQMQKMDTLELLEILQLEQLSQTEKKRQQQQTLKIVGLKFVQKELILVQNEQQFHQSIMVRISVFNLRFLQHSVVNQ